MHFQRVPQLEIRIDMVMVTAPFFRDIEVACSRQVGNNLLDHSLGNTNQLRNIPKPHIGVVIQT